MSAKKSGGISQKVARTMGDNEDNILRQIDLEADFGEDINRVIRMVRNPKFSLSLEMQKNVAKIIRGMGVRMQALGVAEEFDQKQREAFEAKLLEVAGEYEGIFRENLVKLTLDGEVGVVTRLAPQPVTKKP